MPALPPVFRALTATVVPEAAQLDAAGWAELEAVVRRALRDRPPALQRRLRIFLGLIEWAPLFRHGRRFTALEPPARERILTGFQNHRLSRLRVGFWGARTLALMGYYGRPGAGDAIGYRPDPRGWEAAG